ncbi:MAG TPA: hypothetical protein VMJ73_13180 [Rhizomicrobium sp.]|jgi:hypothetical protein|nr:hypothetical protein [Rhizomicrobium sp.]
MKTDKTILFAAAAVLALAAPAAGQGGPYDLKTLNFDLWCQETQHLPPDRCDKRLPSDEADFEAYRAKVEKYEIPYMKSRENGQQLDRVILHNDPVDNPVSQDPSAAAQAPSSPSSPPKP